MHSIDQPFPDTVFTVRIDGAFIGWRKALKRKFRSGRQLNAFKSYPLLLEKGIYNLTFRGDNKQGTKITIKDLEYEKSGENNDVPKFESLIKRNKPIGNLIFSTVGPFARLKHEPFIEIDQNGEIIKGSRDDFPRFLHETNFWDTRGKGPVIIANCPKNGYFSTAIFEIRNEPSVRITLDNKIVYNETLSATNYDYELRNGVPYAHFRPAKIIKVPISKGRHEIKVENSASPYSGHARVSFYGFENVFNTTDLTSLKPGLQWRVRIPTEQSKDHLIEVDFLADSGLAFGTLRVKETVIGTFQGHTLNYRYPDRSDWDATYLFLLPAKLVDSDATELVFATKNLPIKIKSIRVKIDKSMPIITSRFSPEIISKQLRIGSTNGRYFVGEDGIGKFLMGLTLQFPSNELDDHSFVPLWSWFWFADENTILHFLKKMAENGVNHIRIIMNNAVLEPYRGKYSGPKYSLLTALFDKSRKLGIHVTVSLFSQWSLFPSQHHQQSNPILNLFPVKMKGVRMLRDQYRKESRSFFFTNPKTKDYFRESVTYNTKFLFGRPEVMGLQLWDETHSTDKDILQWHDEMANVVKNLMPDKPISTSIAVSNPGCATLPTFDNLSWGIKELSERPTTDFIEPSVHQSWCYTEGGFYQTIKLLANSFDKPVIIGESDWFMNPEYTWESIWAAILAGAAGIKVWGYLSDYHLYLLRPAAWLSRKIDFAKFRNPIIGQNNKENSPIESENMIRYLIDFKGQQALFWIEGKKQFLNIRKINGILPCIWYDPWSGKIIQSEIKKFNPLGTSMEMPGIGVKLKTVLYIGHQIK